MSYKHFAINTYKKQNTNILNFKSQNKKSHIKKGN